MGHAHHRDRCTVLVTVFLALSTTACMGGVAAQDRAELGVRVEVEMQSYFPGPDPVEDELGRWSARYVETGRWTVSRAGDEGYSVAARMRVEELEATAAPLWVDACANEWHREWQGPVEVAAESELEVSTGAAGDVVFWYAPLRPSVMDPGGPRGMGQCHDPRDVDPPTRSVLFFDAYLLGDSHSPVAGLPAVGG